MGDGSWQVGVAVLDKETLEWVDKEIVPDNDLIYQYRLYAIAGKNSSAAIIVITDNNFPAPNNLLIEKKTDVSYKLHWTNSFTGEQGIKIDRRAGQNDWELAFARLEAGQTSYVDTNVFLPKTSKVLVEYKVYGYHDNYHSVKAYGNTNAALTPPSDLQISQNSLTAVTLTWQDNATASQGFKVERRYSANDEWTEIATTTTSEFQDTDFALNTQMYYRVSAFTGEYHSAYAENSFDATIPAPSNLQITQNSITSVTLTWQDNSLGPQGFKIERKIDNDEWTEIATTTTPEFQDTDFALNTQVYYRVSAFTGEYHSAYTQNSFDATIPAPLNLAAEGQSSTSVNISWGYQAVGHQGFKIDRQTDHDAWEVAYATTSPGETSFMDNSVDFEQHGYQYRVYAWYDDYESTKTEVHIARANVTTDGMTSITGTSAAGGGNVTADGGATVTARGIAYGTSENPTLDGNTVSAGSGTGSFTAHMTGLQPVTTYYVRAFATNSTGTAYGNQVSFTTTGTAIVDVLNPATGKTWMDRNLGASHVATSSTDDQAYGYLYQWGRDKDGHQVRTSDTTRTLSNSDNPGHGKFILASTGDWRSPQNHNLWQGVNGINNPCPAGYRLPTEAEWNAERSSWSSNDAAGAYTSPLKLPLAGSRLESSGSLFNVGTYGVYWSSTFSGNQSRFLDFFSNHSSMRSSVRARGRSVRCIKDD